MELIFIFAEVYLEMFVVNLLKVMEIVGAFRIDAFVENKVFAVFFVNKGMPTVRAEQSIGLGKTVVIRREVSRTDLAVNLPSGAIVTIKIGLRGMTEGTGGIRRDVTFLAAGNGFDFLMIFIFKVRDEKLPVPIGLMEMELGKFISFKFEILRGMGIIKGPLLERDIFADKKNKPAILLVKELNESQ